MTLSWCDKLRSSLVNSDVAGQFMLCARAILLLIIVVLIGFRSHYFEHTWLFKKVLREKLLLIWYSCAFRSRVWAASRKLQNEKFSLSSFRTCIYCAAVRLAPWTATQWRCTTPTRFKSLFLFPSCVTFLSIVALKFLRVILTTLGIVRKLCYA